MNKEMKRHLEQFADSLQHLEEPVIITDEKGVILYANQAAARFFHQTANTLLRQSLHSLCQFYDAHKNKVTPSRFTQSIASDSSLYFENYLVKKCNSGKKFHVHLTVTYFANESAANSWLTYIFHPVRKNNFTRSKPEIIRDNLPVGILRLNKHGNVLAGNLAAFEMLNLNQLTQNNFYHLLDIPKLQHSDIIHHFQKLLNHQQECDFDSPLIESTTGKQYYFRLRGIPQANQRNKTAFMILIENITKRKQVEFELREREAQLEAIVKSFDGFGYTINPKHQLENMNERLIRATGYDATGEICFQALYKRQTPCPWCQSSRVFHGETVRYEFKNPNDNRWYYAVNYPIYHANGQLSNQAMILDITDQKNTVSALSQTAKLLRILHEIEQAILSAESTESVASIALRCLNQIIPCWRSSVFSIDYKKNKVLVLAAEFQGSTKIKSASFLPLDSFKYLQHVKPGDIILVRNIDEKDCQYEVPQMLYAEGLRSFLMLPLVYNEKVIGSLNLGSNEEDAFNAGLINIASEIADVLAVAIQNTHLHEQVAKHTQELEQRVAERTRELEAFSYSVSHDLRSPLRAIDGFSRVLQEEYHAKLDSSGQRLLNIIRLNTQKMGHLIDALLSFSRLGRQKLKISNIKINDLVKSVFAELREVHPERKIILNYGQLPDVSGDPIMIRQVFINLIGNAIKFTQNTETAVIEVGCKIQKQHNLYYVTDNGEGFDMRYADKLFELFQSVHSPEKFQGTGVGLAIVKRIIERHGGRVWAEAKMNKGATFYFMLPNRS